MSRGATHLAGIIGWPLEHTLSPVMHNAAFRRLDIDWIYLAFPVPPESLGDAIAGVRALGLRGLNVTMPHKEKVIAYLDELSGDARSLGAVNTIQEVGGRLVGHNTDVDGFSGFMASDAGLEMEGRTALVLGAGGAARAVVRALHDSGAARITVCCREPERAEWVNGLTDRGDLRVWAGIEGLAAKADVVVNATPLGMKGEALLEGVDFHPGQAVIDLVYGPGNTPLVSRARAGGADAWGGLGMLVHQAIASFRIWTGQDPPAQVMSAAALHGLGALRDRTDISNDE